MPRFFVFTCHQFIFLFGIIACYFLSACAPASQREPGPFWPPPPGDPRIQFLSSYSSSVQIEEQDRFRAFIVGKDDAAPERLSKPQGLAEINGKVYVCDSMNSNVFIIDFLNKQWSAITGGEGQQKRGRLFKKPVDVAGDDSGNVYVADAAQQVVYAFTAEGELIRKLGEGQLIRPVAVEARGGKVFVADLKAGMIRVFSVKTGDLIDTFGPELNEEQSLGYPTALSFGPDGQLHIVDTGHRKVFRIDIDGHLMSSLGQLGDASGTFTRPKGIGVDKDNRTWVVDAAFENVQVFNEEGRILTFFGGSGIDPGALYLPSGLAISEENLEFWQRYAAPGFELEFVIFVTNHYGPNRLTVYGFGAMKG